MKLANSEKSTETIKVGLLHSA